MFIVMAVIVFCWRVEAQTNNDANTLTSTNIIYKLVVTTNHVQAASWFREVNGQLYNTQASTRWHYVDGKVYSIQDGGIVVVIRLRADLGFKHVFVKNYTDTSGNGVAKDQFIHPWAMQVGTTNIFYAGNDETFEVWDCGTLHFADVNTTNRIVVKP